jgi:ferritin-like metal-binding protein YciE
MDDQSDYKTPLNLNKIGSHRINVFFINHLNYIYSAKSHLQERLPELMDQATFTDLRNGIAETMIDVDNQMIRMNTIYALLETKQIINLSSGMVHMIEDAFTAIDKYGADVILRDLSMLFYLQSIESLEMASFRVLELASARFKDKQIKQLLKESYDEAKDDNALFLMITARYFAA